MLSYQKNALLSLLAQFKTKLYDTSTDTDERLTCHDLPALNIIDRNLTSIEKQIKKL